MQISAHVTNAGPEHSVTVATNGRAHPVSIPARPDGPGSNLNGGELLCLALATCYCNDLYREAGRRGITLHHRLLVRGLGASTWLEESYRAVTPKRLSKQLDGDAPAPSLKQRAARRPRRKTR